MAEGGGDKGFHTFPKDNGKKMNIIARLEFKIVNYEFIENEYHIRKQVANSR